MLHVAVDVDEEKVLLLLVAEFGSDEEDGSESVAELGWEIEGEGLLPIPLLAAAFVSMSCKGGPGRKVSFSGAVGFNVFGFVGSPCGMESSLDRGFAGRPCPAFPTKLLSFAEEVIAAAA